MTTTRVFKPGNSLAVRLPKPFRFKATELNFAGYLPASLQSNYPEFPDSCLPGQFALVEYVHQVLIDRPYVLLKKLRDERLCQPHGFVLKPALHARLPVLRLVKNEAGLRLGVFAHAVTS